MEKAFADFFAETLVHGTSPIYKRERNRSLNRIVLKPQLGAPFGGGS
jgi:hypothetical protein